MKRLRVTADARADLKEIKSGRSGRSAETTKALLVQITDSFARLCEMPLMGRARDDFGPGLRSLIVGKYLVFYRVNGNILEIVRVLHGARHLETIFEDEA